MRSPTPIPVRRALHTMGAHLATWRKLRGLTADQVAERAGISRSTLVALEKGRGVSLENTLRVARAVGVLNLISDALDPYETDLGRARADETLPQRVRRPADPTRPR